ncbi:MAG: glycosyltransferase [Lachnospiraceae bacterium]|nr:glycosyltransferase [Lachnospiraceae bacterium]
MENVRVDVIIPVYNALDDLKLCVKSLEKCMDFTKDRVVLVNDCSPDERIKTYLDSIESEHFVVLHNKSNMGFSASVNNGMKFSKSDVILLNSDTIVTTNWVNKIYECAYSEEYIATVTPFSNSATICSLPKYCQDNDLPVERVEDSAKVIEKISLKRHPRIPVAHGFCMFIKRSVIDLVGLFNAEVFQRGYGEENDFCYRCEQYGYKHVICDNAFVYHKGTASFSNAQKAKLIESHSQWLQKKYPYHEREISRYVAKDDNWDIRVLYDIFMSLENSKKRNILYVMHLDFKEGSPNRYGGIQMHVKDLKDNLISDSNVFVLVKENDFLVLTIYADFREFELKFKIYGNACQQIFYDEQYYTIYKKIIESFKINVVHVHHIMGMSYDIYKVAKELNVPIITTLHDYYFICPGLWMMDINNRLCIGNESREKCKKCLRARKEICESVDIIEEWRKTAYKALMLSDSIVSPSEYAKNIYAHYFPELAGKIVVIEHGSDYGIALNDEKITDKCKYYIEFPFNSLTSPKAIHGWAYIPGADSRDSRLFISVEDSNGKKMAYPAELEERGDVANGNEDILFSGFNAMIPFEQFAEGQLKIKLVIINKHDKVAVSDTTYYGNYPSKKKESMDFNIAFIGGIAEHKGSRTIESIVKSKKIDTSVKWFLFGGIGDKRIADIPDSMLKKTGFYTRENLPRLIDEHGIKLIGIFSDFPETFCYTLSEALMCGIPVIVKDNGALGERVKALNCGWTVSLYPTEKEIVKLINHIVDNPKEYDEKAENVKKLKIKTCTEMAMDYRVLMDQFECMIEYRDFDKKFLYAGVKGMEEKKLSEKDVLNYEQQLKETRNALLITQNELDKIINSDAWKVVITLGKVKFPLKQKLKKVLINCFGKKENRKETMDEKI